MIELQRWVEQLTEMRTVLAAADRGCLLVVATADAALEQDLAGVLAEALDGRVEQYAFDAAYPSLAAYLETRPSDGPRVVLAHGLDDLPAEARARALRHLNREREGLARTGRSIVLFIRPGTVHDLTFQAGDLWSWRSGYYEFTAPPDGAARQEALAALRLSLPAPLEALRRRYLEYLVAAYRWLDLRGLMQVRNLVRLPLAQVYTPLSATEEIEVRPAPPLDFPEQRELSPAPGLTRVTRRVTLDQALREHRRVVLLGDPGSGKSTFLRYLALACAEGPQAARERLGLDDAPLPILVPLAAYVLELKTYQPPGSPPPSLADFLPRYFQGLELPDLSPLFVHCLREGRAVLLLDGLDEVISADERRIVTQAGETLAAKHPRRRFVVTSRIAGYDAAPLSGDFVRLTISPLGREDIRRFAHRWSLAYEAAGRELSTLPPEIQQRADARAEALFAAITSHPAIERLATNPLLLTILALIHYQGTRLPHRRVELYRLCVEALAETWNLARSLSGRPIDLWLGDRRLDERTVVQMLAPVAFWMHRERPGGLASREDLISQLMAASLRLSSELASDFLELAREQMGLLVERGQGQFGFIHLTFQEYLAARHIAAQENPFALLRPCLQAPRWREVVLLTAGILGDFSSAHASRFLRAVLGARSPYEQLLHRDLRLALRILADDVPVENPLAEEVVGRAARLLRSARYEELRDGLASGLAALGGGLYAPLAARHLLAALRDKDADMRRRAAEALGKLGRDSDKVLGALLAALRDRDVDVRRATAEALRAALRDEDVREAAAGALGELGQD
ncbi:MAG: NACHT domain-containing protein, partial [Anaerolineae bacterium]|nr:NACHT domain-containing protein [Anaerolineae bacterium]